MHQKIERAADLIEWLGAEPLCRFALCDNCEPMKSSELIEIIEKLETAGFYELIVVLMLRSYISAVGERVMNKFAASAVADKIRTIGASSASGEIIKLLKDEFATV